MTTVRRRPFKGGTITQLERDLLTITAPASKAVLAANRKLKLLGYRLSTRLRKAA